MDSNEAIELIKSDVAHLVKTIQQQDKMLELAINAVARHCCPDSDETVEQISTCPEYASITLVKCADCWRKYLQGEVGK